MEQLTGKAVFGGIATGRIYVLNQDKTQVKREKVTDTKTELSRFEEARMTAKQQLKQLYEKALVEVGEVNAMIFEAHQIMLEDLDYIEAITNKIEKEEINAEYAVEATGEFYAELFANLEDDYLKARAVDVRDVSNRIIDILQGKNDSQMVGEQWEEKWIVVAKDLTPSETVQLDKSKVTAFVTEKGSTNSHTAILARTMNIPALIEIPFSDELHGKLAIVDGYSSKLIIDPTKEIAEHYESLMQEENEKKRRLLSLKGKENETLDGKMIQLYANIGSVSDLALALQNDAAGIGLFRSEFMYIGRSELPSEEEQFVAYKKVVEGMAGKKVIIRTLDIGADKKVDYLHLDLEENPAMGYRGIRICLDRKDIFKTQLRAIYRASAYGTVSIMYPMIISVSELQQIKAIVEEVKRELTEQGIEYGNVEQGVMIETPAAVMISDLLAKEVDFFSIGTNDLSQYTLAIDRQNQKLDAFYDPYHEAVLRMIAMTIENGHRENCWVGVCGELGADLSMTKRFLQMGIDELSVSPGMLLKVREEIRNTRIYEEN